MDLFAELDRAPQDPLVKGRPRQTSAQRKAIAARRRELEEIAAGAPARPRLDYDAQCAAPCPTVLAPADDPDLCEACRRALLRAGAGSVHPA